MTLISQTFSYKKEGVMFLLVMANQNLNQLLKNYFQQILKAMKTTLSISNSLNYKNKLPNLYKL